MTDTNGLPPGFGVNDPDFIREAYQESKNMKDGDSSGGKVFYLKPGVTHLRFLPPHEDAVSWFRSLKEHGLHTNGKYGTVTCPTSVDESECPICEAGRDLYENVGTEISIKKAKKLYPKQVFLYNAYVYSSPDGEKGLSDGIVVVKSGVKVFKQLMEYDNDPAGDWGDTTNLTNGVDFRIDRTGKGRFDTEYSVKGVPTRSNIIEKIAAAGLKFGKPHNLFEIFPPFGYEELEMKYKQSDEFLKDEVID